MDRIKPHTTIVFINRVPTSRVLANVIDFDALARAGFKLLLLDLSPYYYPDTRHKFGSGNPDYVFTSDWTVSCSTPDDARKVIREHAKTAWFFLLHHTYTAFPDEGWMFRAFRKYGCSYFIKDIDNLPVMSTFGFGVQFSFFRYFLNRVWNNLWHIASPEHIRQARGFIMTWMITKGLYLPSPAYTFAAGRISRGLMRKLYPSSQTISIPSVDYSNFHRIRSSTSNAADIPGYPYILYIDQCPFAGPDAKLLGYSLMDKETYLARITQFFDRVEHVCGKKIVIGASLKYRYDGNEFKGREVFHNRTGDLAYHADMVIAHNSNAVTLPILMKKPIIFVIMEGLADYMIHETHLLAGVLGKNVLHYHEDLDRTKLMERSAVNDARYDAYILDYLAEEPFTESIGAVIAKALCAHDAGMVS